MRHIMNMRFRLHEVLKINISNEVFDYSLSNSVNTYYLQDDHQCSYTRIVGFFNNVLSNENNDQSYQNSYDIYVIQMIWYQIGHIKILLLLM